MAACILWACGLPDLLILFMLSLALAPSTNPRPLIVSLGSSSVYKSECLYGSRLLFFLGSLFSDTGRHENRIWCYWVDNVIQKNKNYFRNKFSWKIQFKNEKKALYSQTQALFI